MGLWLWLKTQKASPTLACFLDLHGRVWPKYSCRKAEAGLFSLQESHRECWLAENMVHMVWNPYSHTLTSFSTMGVAPHVFLRFYLFTFRERRHEGEREGEKHRLVATPTPPSGDLATTQACALTGNQTGNLLVRRQTGDFLVRRQAVAQFTEPQQPGQLPVFSGEASHPA